MWFILRQSSGMCGLHRWTVIGNGLCLTGAFCLSRLRPCWADDIMYAGCLNSSQTCESSYFYCHVFNHCFRQRSSLLPQHMRKIWFTVKSHTKQTISWINALIHVWIHGPFTVIEQDSSTGVWSTTAVTLSKNPAIPSMIISPKNK